MDELLIKLQHHVQIELIEVSDDFRITSQHSKGDDKSIREASGDINGAYNPS